MSGVAGWVVMLLKEQNDKWRINNNRENIFFVIFVILACQMNLEHLPRCRFRDNPSILKERLRAPD